MQLAYACLMILFERHLHSREISKFSEDRENGFDWICKKNNIYLIGMFKARRQSQLPIFIMQTSLKKQPVSQPDFSVYTNTRFAKYEMLINFEPFRSERTRLSDRNAQPSLDKSELW